MFILPKFVKLVQIYSEYLVLRSSGVMFLMCCHPLFLGLIYLMSSFIPGTELGGFRCNQNTVHLQCHACGGMMPSRTDISVPQHCTFYYVCVCLKLHFL